MKKQKKQTTLTKLVVFAWMVVVVISNISIGVLSYILYQNQLYDARADEAMNVAVATAVRIDGDKFADIMKTLEKNDYWYEVKNYADAIAEVFDTAYVYILDKNYTDEVTYFAEGAPGDSPFDLGMTEEIEGVYADEMFDTLRTGTPTATEPYPSGEYGDMVSGFGAILDANGSVVGVVGVDFFYENVEAQLRSFVLSLVIIIVVFIIGSYFLMTFLGTKMAGTPLTNLDIAARRFAVGDMDITFDIHSKTEIGRLADSFTRIIGSMKEQVAALEVLSNGDLTPDVEPRGDKDIMGIAISQILVNLNDMLKEIKQSAANVSIGAGQLSDNAQSLALGASEQAGAVERLSSSIADVTGKTNENRDIADKTNQLTDTIKQNAQIGSEQMNRMMLAVKEITDASASINKVIKVIDDIAFQTNILALNAAVEAARAGQHGKGFAVVAEEVRNLASRSADAAKDSEQLILDSIEKAKLGASIADETVSYLNKIIAGVNECATSVSVISSSLNDQIHAMAQINKDIEQVSQVVQENSATAEESADASRQMREQAQVLDELVSQFKLKDQILLHGQSAASTSRAALPASREPRN